MLVSLLRRVVPPLLHAALGCVVAAIAVYVFYLESRPDLRPWHLAALETEFRAADADRVQSLDGYRQLEDRLFAELDAEVVDQVAPEDRRDANRFWAGSRSNPERFAKNWNRSFELPAAAPVAGALLLHGLTDSPYSLRALAEPLNAAGVHVVGLRLPGHGTAPAGLVDVTAEDWQAAVRLAARHLRTKIGPDRPILLAGYSNGAALAVDHALAVLEGQDLPRVAGLVLLSPAIQVTQAAGYAHYQAAVARLTGLEKLGWTDIQPEFDPYKYNSFTVNAGAQIHDLTADIARRLDRLARSGPVQGFPPVLAFQSAADATIIAEGIVGRLMGRLAPGRHELVVFDVNRDAEAEPLLRPEQGLLASRLLADARQPFAVTVLTNAGPDSQALVARRRAAGSDTVTTEALNLAWPGGIFSLSHVALPFRPDDPIYGGPEGRAAGGDALITLGDITLLGERGLLQIPDGFFLRLRYNPFFSYVEERVRRFLKETLPVG
jgi:alpha-beta hydrolase superfamily lysophospholipase